MTSLRLAALLSVAYALAPASRPLPGRRRGVTITKAIDDLFSDAMRAVQDFSEVAAPIVKGGVDTAAPYIKAGADAAAPVVKQGLSKTAEAAASGLSAAERAALTEEQIRQLAKAGQVAGQVGDVAGYVGRGALKASKVVVDAAVPYVEPSARLVGRAANDVLDKGTLSEGTRAALAESGRGAEQAAARGVGSLLRGAASLLDSGDVAPPAPRSGAANVADAFAGSLGRALAPYAAGLAVLAVALAALRELFAPVEKVARQALSLALLVAVVAFCVDHWDAVYGSFQVVSGEKPLFAWPF
jgi:hypothetical protein